MNNVLLLPPFREEHIHVFEDMEGYTFSWTAEPDDRQLKEARIVLGIPKPQTLKKFEHLEWLQLASAGADQFVRAPECVPKGAVVTTLSGAFGHSMAEFALLMVLALYKHLHLFRDHQNECLWTDEGVQETPAGKKLLILGAGDIGTAIAKIFRPFGCEITGLRRTVKAVPEGFDRIIDMNGLDKALSEADIVACVLPDTPQTRGLLNRDRLGLLKPNAVLVNLGRGNLIDTDALVECLNANRIWGAGLDVTDPEPLPPEHPLWKCKNLILTPHVSGGSIGHLRATEEKLFSICRENLVRYREGKPLLNVLDFETGYRSTENRV